MALVKCPECAREVSTAAPACPHCGHPIATAFKETMTVTPQSPQNEMTEGAPEITPAQAPPAAAPPVTNVGKGCMGCLGVIILLVLIGWIGDMAGCNGGSGTGQSTESAKPTKAEWKEKLGSKFGFSAKMGIIENLKSDQFKSVMGAPARTQTIGDDAFWYYECSDGMIQLELYAPNLAVGMMQGKVNDY